MRAFVDAAHARGMKVYLDIITNHTADVIQYRECRERRLPVSLDARTIRIRARAALQGPAINAGFAGDGAAHRRQLRAADTRSTTPTRPSCRRPKRNVKVPAWLNSTIYYHNRGNSDFWGESSLFGDFVGLDDLMTENPRVVQGFIDIYGDWIDRYAHRRLPHRHRASREPGVLAGLRAGHAQARARRAAFPTSTSSVKWPPRASTWRSSRATRASTSCRRCWISASRGAVEKVIAGNEGTDVLARLYAGRRALRGRRAGGAAAAHLHRQS